jgi:hypothetical protein
MSDDGGEVLQPVVTRLDLHPAAADLPNTVGVEGKEQSASRRSAKHSGAPGVVGCQLQWLHHLRQHSTAGAQPCVRQLAIAIACGRCAGQQLTFISLLLAHFLL